MKMATLERTKMFSYVPSPLLKLLFRMGQEALAAIEIISMSNKAMLAKVR